MTVFRKADGLLVCSNCGATYSEALLVCPQCKMGALKEETDPVIVYLCNQRPPCPIVGEDGVCCLSCNRLHKCKRVCPTAESYGKSQLDEDDVLCEFMEVKQ